jgi:DNA-binding PadR family transcriptional regulator
LEQNDCVTSEWDVTGKGPAKRVYRLTPRGQEHLAEWIAVLDHVARSMTRFVRTAGKQARDMSKSELAAPLRRSGKRAAKTAEPALGRSR